MGTLSRGKTSLIAFVCLLCGEVSVCIIIAVLLLSTRESRGRALMSSSVRWVLATVVVKQKRYDFSVAREKIRKIPSVESGVRTTNVRLSVKLI